jgi:uncharacterized protein (DUF1015 family)
VTPSPPVPLVAPFAGERYAAANALAQLLAPPYDVIDDARRGELRRRSPHNIVRLILPEGNGDRYSRAAELLSAWRRDGVLARDVDPSVTVVRHEFTVPGGSAHARTGVIGAVAVERYRGGRVRPHEKTHAQPKADRLALLRATRSVFDALLLLTRDPAEELRRLLLEATAAAPTGRAELDGEVLTLWRVTGGAADAVAAAAGSGPLYIADGHHRYETAMAYFKENARAGRTLGLVVPVTDPGVVVLPTHRLVHSGAARAVELLPGLRDRFRVRELPDPRESVAGLRATRGRGTACVLALPGQAFLLLLKGGAGDLAAAGEPAVAGLDVARVDALVVGPLRAAAGPGAWVDYTADASRLLGEVQAGRAAGGVLLNPPTLEQVLAVADAGATMPQKSTYFAPKVPSGLVLLDVA